MQQNLLKPEEVKPEFWEQFFPKLEKFRKNFAKQALSHEQYPEFMGHIAELAEKAGLKYVPHVVIGEIPFGGGIAYTANAAAALNERGIIINPKMMKATNANLNSRLTPELENWVAHELGHLKDGFLHIWSLQNCWTVSPIVAMAGLYLYDKAHEKTPHLENQNKDEHLKALEQNLHKAADEEIEKIKNEKKEGWHLDPKWQEEIMNAGRYSMAAAIGLAAGSLCTRYGVLAAEYRADRMAVEIVRKPEAFKNTISTIAEEFQKFAEHNNRQIKYLKQQGFTPTLKKIIQDIYTQHIVHAHPTDMQRISHIDRVAKQIEAQAAIGL